MKVKFDSSKLTNPGVSKDSLPPVLHFIKQNIK